MFFNVAVVIRAVGAAWESLDRRPGEAAAALGASPAQVLRTVTLPALRPAIVSAASVVFLFCATAFGVVLTLGGVRYATVETEIYLLTTTLFDLHAAAALSLVQLVVVVVLLVVAARLRPRPTRPPRVDVPAAADPVRRRDRSVAGAPPCCSSRRGAADRHPRARLLPRRRRLEPGQLPRPHHRGRATRPCSCRSPTRWSTSLRTAVDATWMALLMGLACRCS